MIAEGLGLGSDDIDLAWFLGILHDMGRFEEILGTGRDRFTDAPMAGDEIMACVYAHQCVPRKLTKSVFDNTITYCCMAFDLQLKVTRTIVKEQGYLLKIIHNERHLFTSRIMDFPYLYYTCLRPGNPHKISKHGAFNPLL